MSNKSISVGDLVMVVHSCGAPVYIGMPFIVAHIKHKQCQSCMYCKSDHSGLFAYPAKDFRRTNGTFGDRIPMSWLLRIDPPALSEAVPTGEELFV